MRIHESKSATSVQMSPTAASRCSRPSVLALAIDDTPRQVTQRRSADAIHASPRMAGQRELGTGMQPTSSRATPRSAAPIQFVHGSFQQANYAGANNHQDVVSAFLLLQGNHPSLFLHSQILRANLQRDGVPDSNLDAEATDNQAHHIVEVNDAHALPGRQLLARAGIDINSSVNGVFLPTAIGDDTGDATVHVGSHVQVYANSVNQALAQAVNNDAVLTAAGLNAAAIRGGAPLSLAQQARLRQVLIACLNMIRNLLLSEHLPINKRWTRISIPTNTGAAAGKRINGATPAASRWVSSSSRPV